MRASEEQVQNVAVRLFQLIVGPRLDRYNQNYMGMRETWEHKARFVLDETFHPFDEVYENVTGKHKTAQLTIELEDGDKVLVWRKKA